MKKFSLYVLIIISFSIGTTLLLARSQSNIKACMQKTQYQEFKLAGFNYDIKTSNLDYCYISEYSKIDKQCFRLNNLREATVSTAKVEKSKNVKSLKLHDLGDFKENFGASQENTYQGLMNIYKHKTTLCEGGLYGAKVKGCHSIKISYKLRKKLKSFGFSKIRAFWNKKYFAVMRLNTSSVSSKDDFLMAKKVRKKYTLILKTRVNNNGLEFTQGFFRNSRPFLNHCAAGPGCQLSWLPKKSTGFKVFPVNGYDLSEVSIFRHKVLISSFDGSQFTLYDDKQEKIIKSKSYENDFGASQLAHVMRFENTYVVFYAGISAGKVAVIDPLSLRLETIVKLPSCK